MIIKTIFRILRQFYKRKLDEVLGKRRKNKPRPEIFWALEKLTENMLKTSFKKRIPAHEQHITKHTLANYIGALVMPKCI